MTNSLQPHGLGAARLLCPWNSPVKNIEVGCLSLLHVIFPTHGQTGSSALQEDSLPTKPPGKPTAHS